MIERLYSFKPVYILLCAFLLVMPIWAQEGEQDAEDKVRNTIQNPMRKLQLAEFAIANLYVDSVDENRLVEDAIKGMLEKLDPHSAYSTPEEVKRMNEPLQGNFEGIGVQFNMVEDTLFIIQPVSGGPSEKVGILAGDRIVTVNDTTIAGVKMSREEIMRRLRGAKGTHVELGIKRHGISEVLKFDVVRDKIPLHTLDAAYMLRKGIGYIKISSFGSTTFEEFTNAVNKLKKKGMKHLVLDLQGNGGGYLNAAVDIANQFLEPGELIVYTEGLRSPRREFKAEGNGKFRKGKVVVLIDEFSASASEIVSGAIQDWDRGDIVGRRSFGKGLVQRPLNLPDGSMIRLTVSRYYTPAGRCIQKPYADKDKYKDDLMERLNNGELIHSDSIHFPDSLKYSTRKLGRVVYGGGGIMPDYFIPLDTTRYNSYHRSLAAKGVIIQTSLRFIDNNRDELLRKYKDFETFNGLFHVNDELLDQLVEKGVAADVKYDEKFFAEAKPMLMLQIKALIARDLWSMNEYFQVMNEQNESVLKAISILQ